MRNIFLNLLVAISFIASGSLSYAQVDSGVLENRYVGDLMNRQGQKMRVQVLVQRMEKSLEATATVENEWRFNTEMGVQEDGCSLRVQFKIGHVDIQIFNVATKKLENFSSDIVVRDGSLLWGSLLCPTHIEESTQNTSYYGMAPENDLANNFKFEFPGLAYHLQEISSSKNYALDGLQISKMLPHLTWHHGQDGEVENIDIDLTEVTSF